MFKRMLFCIILLVLVAQIGISQHSGIGLGLALGNPTGVDCKGWLTYNGAIHISVGWWELDSDAETALSAEYLWHAFPFNGGGKRFPIYYGIGGFFGNDLIAARGVLGIEWWPRGSNFDIFLQLMPALYFKPDSDFDFDFQCGVRYFF